MTFSPDLRCPSCKGDHIILDETTMLSSTPPQRPAWCRNCGHQFAIPASGFLTAAKAAKASDDIEKLRDRVQELANRDRDAIKWRERWREANAEGLRLREALTEIAVEDHQGMTAAQRAQAALDGDEE